MDNPRIYLAGPDVFFSDAANRFERLRGLCLERGLLGVSPLDGESPVESTAPGISRTIYQENVAKIRGAAGVLANLSPFRSPTEPDCGTAFELGFAAALGLPAAGWLPEAEKSYLRRIAAAYGTERRSGLPGTRCLADGGLVEDFNLPINLMLAQGARIFSSPEQALDYLSSKLIGARGKTPPLKGLGAVTG